MDYFRAVSAAEEHSDRVLALTEAIVRLNPSHYTVWYVYLLGCHEALGSRGTSFTSESTLCTAPLTPQAVPLRNPPRPAEGPHRRARAHERVRARESQELPSLVCLLHQDNSADERHHRLLLLEHISPDDPSFEIEFIHASLQPDPKNYHTWAYLHWLYCHFSELGRISDARWAEELSWCEDMLELDGRNNSAWGWRWFLRMARPGVDQEVNGPEEIK